MSAFVTIANNTPNPWFCKVKKNQSNLLWQDMASTVVAGVTAALALSPALKVNGAQILGVPAKFMIQENVPVATGVVAYQTSRFGTALSGSIANYLKQHEYLLYMPGEQKKSPANTNEKIRVVCKQISTSVSNGMSQATVQTMWNDVSTNGVQNIKTWADATTSGAWTDSPTNSVLEAIVGK